MLGGAFNFFADLTNPDAAWALVVAVSAIVAAGAGPVGSMARRTTAAAAGWIIGFAWMWLSKWVVASFVVGYSTVRDVVRSQAGSVSPVTPQAWVIPVWPGCAVRGTSG